MTRSEILQIAKPILFNSEMVRAILDDRKTVTRRVVKGQIGFDGDRAIYHPHKPIVVEGREYESVGFSGGIDHFIRDKAPYKPDDYLYVPEAWKCTAIYKTYGYNIYGYDVEFKDGTEYHFEFLDKERFKKYEKYLDKPEHQWQSPYFMPKEVARIFLRVMGVRVERLKDMTADSATSEGFTYWNDVVRVWDSTIPPKDRDKYGWAANPWVWVIEFEKVEVQE